MGKPKRVVIVYVYDTMMFLSSTSMTKLAFTDKGIDLIVIKPAIPVSDALVALQKTINREQAAGRDVFCIMDIGLHKVMPLLHKKAAEIFDSGVPVARYSLDVFRDDLCEEEKKKEYLPPPKLRRDWAYIFTFDDTPTDIADAIADWYDKQAVTAQP